MTNRYVYSKHFAAAKLRDMTDSTLYTYCLARVSPESAVSNRNDSGNNCSSRNFAGTAFGD